LAIWQNHLRVKILRIQDQEEVVNDSRVTKEELIEKAKKPAQDSLKMHPYYKGKIEIVPKCVIRGINDFAIWYTPGVAEPCM
jgi:malate dehydrogenase (oxaloacetate-decarboxylating)